METHQLWYTIWFEHLFKARKYPEAAEGYRLAAMIAQTEAVTHEAIYRVKRRVAGL